MNHQTISLRLAVVLSCLAAWPAVVFAEEAALVFREDFKEIPPATPITQKHIATPGLLLELHGPGGQRVKKSHHANKAGDPWYVWSGQCNEKWALSLRPETYRIDLSGAGARFRWRTKQQGDRHLRLLIKCPGDHWYVSGQSTGATPDWAESGFSVADLTWRSVDVTDLSTGEAVHPPDLENVEAIGFTDLEVGKGSGVCSRLDWIEVYGKEIPLPKSAHRDPDR